MGEGNYPIQLTLGPMPGINTFRFIGGNDIFYLYEQYLGTFKWKNNNVAG